MLKWTCSLFFIFFVAAPMAQAAGARDLLEQDILSRVQLLKKDIKIFHYFSAPQDSDDAGVKKIHPSLVNSDARNIWVNYLIGLRAGVFWDMNNHSTSYINAGPGMYYAIDPNSSRDFGDSAVELNVKQGTPYISVVHPIPLQKETLVQLQKEGIISKVQLAAGEKTLGLNNGIYGATLKNMVRVENLKFRSLLAEIFAKNSIQFIEYLYQSHLAGFCKTANQSAFVFIGHPPENKDTANKETLAALEDNYKNSPLLSDLNGLERSPEETVEIDKIMRFREVLSQIRIKGTLAAKNLISDNLREAEIQDLADHSYECVRKY